MSWKRAVLFGVLAAIVAATVGPWVYINLIRDEAPEPLGLATSTPEADVRAGGSAGGWTVAEGSVVGYRVKEVLFGQDATAVGRTQDVTGAVDVDGTTITAASFTADLTTVRSDEERRDRQFSGRIMDTGTYPTATFALTEPIELGAEPADGETFTETATGDLTLRGTTKTVTFQVSGRRTGDAFQVTGQIPVVFAEWNIPDPSFGPARTEDRGILEFSLNLAPESDAA